MFATLLIGFSDPERMTNSSQYSTNSCCFFLFFPYSEPISNFVLLRSVIRSSLFLCRKKVVAVLVLVVSNLYQSTEWTVLTFKALNLHDFSLFSSRSHHAAEFLLLFQHTFLSFYLRAHVFDFFQLSSFPKLSSALISLQN